MGGGLRRVVVRLQRVRPWLFQIQLVEANPALAAKTFLNPARGEARPFRRNKQIIF